MIRASTLAALLLLAQLPQPTSAPREGTGLILGRIVDGGSGRPVGGATVTLGPGMLMPGAIAAGEQTLNLRTLTDSEGYFLFRGLPAGSYSIGATKPAYLAGAYGRRRPEGLTQSLTLADGQRLGDVIIPMWKVAAITGVIVDEAGEPLTSINVRCYRKTFVSGRPRLRESGGGQTDDRGVYRIWTLAPGEYVVGVESSTVAVPADIAALYQGGFEAPNDPKRLALSREMSSLGGIGSLENTRVGGFVVSARPGTVSLAREGRPFTYPTTFYPSATVAAQARSITVASGEERSGIDIQLKPVPAVQISGTAGTPDGPAANVAVRLVASGAELLATDLDVAATITDSSGAFTFIGVPAGQYMVRMLQQPPPPPRTNAPNTATTSIQIGSMTMGSTFSTGGVAPPIPDGPTYWESMPLAVGPKDVSGVMLTLRPAGRLSGRAEFEGTAQRPNPEALQRIQLVLESATGTNAQTRTIRGRVEADGQLKTPGIPPGRYFLRVLGAPPPWTLKSALHEGRDLADVAFDATGANVSGVVLTFTDAVTELSGTVTRGGTPDGDATVLFFPTDAESWTDWGATPRRLRAVRTTAAGTYAARGLPAGDYYVAAVPDEISGDWQEPKFLESLVASAAQVRIEDGQKKTQALRTARVR